MKFLNIFLLIVLVFCFYSYISQNQIKNNPTNTISQPIAVNQNKLILNSKDTNKYNEAINQPTELDFLSKDEVFNKRKQYTAMYPNLIDQSYSPSNDVYGQITSGKPWWGLKGLNCKGPGEHSIDGLSKMTRYINNPLLLIGLDTTHALVAPNWDCSEFFPEPVELYYQPGEKKGVVVYDMSKYFETIKDTPWNNPDMQKDRFDFNGDNARDFGYNFAYSDYSQNISFVNPDNLGTNVQTIKSFMHTGGSCGYTGGCNNGSPNQPELHFDVTNLPATIKIKLWKQMPSNKQDTADVYFDVMFK